MLYNVYVDSTGLKYTLDADSATGAAMTVFMQTGHMPSLVEEASPTTEQLTPAPLPDNVIYVDFKARKRVA